MPDAAANTVASAVAASVPGSNSTLKNIAINAGIAVGIAAGQAVLTFLPAVGNAIISALPVLIQPYVGMIFSWGVAGATVWFAKKAKDNHVESINTAVAMPASQADAVVAKAYGDLLK